MTRRNAISFWNGPNGSVIRWRCNCGHEGILDASGSHADRINAACVAPHSDTDAATTTSQTPATNDESNRPNDPSQQPISISQR